MSSGVAPSAERLRRGLRRVVGEIRIPDLVLEDVYVVRVPAQLASSLLRVLTTAAPMLELTHLKRIASDASEKGREKAVQFLLCYLGQWEALKAGPVGALLGGVEPSVMGVPKYAPATPQQYQDFGRIWPCKGLKKEDNLELQTGEATAAAVSDEELLRMAGYLRRAAAEGSTGVVIVDPGTGEVLGAGRNGGGSCSCSGGGGGGGAGNPLQHAAVAAIAEVADWNLRCFPDEEAEGEEEREEVAPPQPQPRKRKAPHAAQERPYLCTGYHVYATLEPCLMCAMACVHSRVSRVVYRTPNPTIGALGSVYMLQTIKSLNHHFEVFCLPLDEES